MYVQSRRAAIDQELEFAMKELRPRTDLPKHVEQSLQDLYVRLGLPPIVERLRDEVLSSCEIQLIERAGIQKVALPIDAAAIVLRIVAKQRLCSLECALLDLSHSVNLLDAGRYKSLRQAIGEPIDRRQLHKVPHWDAESGELLYDGVVVREVAKDAANVRLLLQAFEEQGWRPRIDDPFPRGTRVRTLRNTVDTLKDKLTAITFRCDRSNGVTWCELLSHRHGTGV